MISRRTFASRAALFVLGCALQVSGAATLLKRKAVSRIEEVRAGMVFTPPLRSEQWQVIAVRDSDRYTRNLLCIPVIPLHTRQKSGVQNITKYEDWQAIDPERPMAAVFCSSGLEALNFHCPV